MNRQFTMLGAMLLSVCATSSSALDYPGKPPGQVTGEARDGRMFLANEVLGGQWTLDAGRITALLFASKHTGQTLRMKRV